MRDLRKPARSQATGQDQIMTTAHALSVAVAQTALDVICGNRWMQTGKGQQAYALAIMVMRLENELGVVHAKSYADERITAMASAANQIVLLARDEVEAGAVVICLNHEGHLVSPTVEMALMMAYTLVALPA